MVEGISLEKIQCKKRFENNTKTLKAGKQDLIIYDYDKPALVVEEPDNYIPDQPSYDTDTVENVRFFNLMSETPGVASDLKLQYQCYGRRH
jgi:hypothetical protein